MDSGQLGGRFLAGSPSLLSLALLAACFSPGLDQLEKALLG